MSDEKNKSPNWLPIAVPVLVTVLAGGTAPWWWEKFFGNNSQPPQVAQQPATPPLSASPSFSASPVPTVSASIAPAPSPVVTISSTPFPSASTSNTTNAPVDINWSNNPYSLDIKTSKELKFAFTCPAFEQPSDQTDPYSLLGTNPYTARSSICLAGVHSGVITKERGGVVNIEVRGQQQNFIGSQRFGVLSKEYMYNDYSFVVIGANVPENKLKK